MIAAVVWTLLVLETGTNTVIATDPYPFDTKDHCNIAGQLVDLVPGTYWKCEEEKK